MADKLLEKEQDDLFGTGLNHQGVRNKVSPLQESIDSKRDSFFQTGNNALVGPLLIIPDDS